MKTPRATSPYALLQECFRDEPWKLLVVCIMLNQTSAKQVKQVIDAFFERWPGPWMAQSANLQSMAEVIKPLGLYNRRAKIIIEMSRMFLTNDWQEIEDLPGVGKYAADSWKIFVLGEIVEDVMDKELRNYVNWAKSSSNEVDPVL